MKKERIRAYALVAIQFVCIAWILLTGPLRARPAVLLVVETVGWLVGMWAWTVMGPAVFHVLPIPRPGARLVASGPYRWVRHPMYFGVLLVTGALVAAYPTLVRVAFWLALFGDLLLKIRFEERLLSRSQPGYGAYAARTRSLIPFVL